MQGLGLLLIVVGIAIGATPAALNQWRNDPPGAIKTLKLVGIYMLYAVLGVAGLILLLAAGQGDPDRLARPLTGAFFAWILYGALTLTRVMPRYYEQPRWLMRFGIADVVLLAMLFGCLLAYLWIA